MLRRSRRSILGFLHERREAVRGHASIRRRLDRCIPCCLDDEVTRAHLKAGADWATSSALYSITRTADELSVVAPSSVIPEGIRREGGWRALQVEGPLELSLTGILASLAVPLAEAGIPIFAISTYDTDLVLVQEKDLNAATDALARSGWDVN